MLGEVHRLRGHVNQFLGDGSMALFGALIAHEDHAAARSAPPSASARPGGRRYRRSGDARDQLQVRMGLKTGPVLVGSIVGNLRMDYTAVGDTTNLAARLLGWRRPARTSSAPTLRARPGRTSSSSR